MRNESRRPAPRDWRGALAVAGAALGWGSAYPATVLVLATLPPIGAAAWRGIFTLLAIVLLLALTGRLEMLRFTRRQAGPILVLGILGGALFTISLNGAILIAGPSVAAFGVGTFPVLMTLSAPLVLGERLRAEALLAVAAAAVGVFLLARPATGIPPAGFLVAGAAAVLFSSYLNLSRRWGLAFGLHSAAIAVSAMLAAVVVSAPVQAWLDPGGLVPSFAATELIGFAWLALPSGALAYLAALFGVRRLPAEYSSAFFFLVPISGAVISMTLLDDPLDGVQLFGGALIVVAILMVTVPWRAFAVRRLRPGR